MSNTLLIWDIEEAPPIGDWITVLWRGFSKTEPPSAISIPELVEEQAESLRARYLDWIYELGEMRINGKRLVDHLELYPGFSYWWMTSLAQKFNSSGTSQIDNAIKAFVLESLVLEHNPTSIVLVSGNDRIASTFKIFCRKKRLRFKRKQAPRSSDKSMPLVRRLFKALPYPARAFISLLRYIAEGMPLFRKKKSLSKFRGEVTFIDVLVHLNTQTFSKGKFVSNYWTSLTDTLLQLGVKTNWLHNYFPQPLISSRGSAKRLTERFNINSNGRESHELIETNLSFSVLLNTLGDYFRTSRASFRLSTINSHFSPTGSSLDLWPLFRDEWIESLRGQSAIINCLRISLYKETFTGMPPQKIGIYIQENQPWEMALIYAWKAAGHGQLIGVPHTNVRFWDLRYFYDPRSYTRFGKNVLPMPDLVAVNGPVAKKAYLQGGYPATQIMEVEALRFMHILNYTQEKSSAVFPDKALKVLICGDFLSSTTHKMLSWLSIAAQSLPPRISYIFKPHPAYPVDLNDYKSLNLEVTDASLVELFSDCDVVFTSNITSAAVDAYACGIPVIQMLDGAFLNMSPMRGLKNVVYVTDPPSLVVALHDTKNREHRVPAPFFYLDKALPRWKRILDLDN